MSTLMTTQTPGMVSPPGTVPFSLDAIRRQVLRRVTDHEPPETTDDVNLLRMKEDEDTEGPIAHGRIDASQADDDPSDTAVLNGICGPADPSALAQAPSADAASGGEEDIGQLRPADEPRRNKRKNFRPRNILYDAAEDAGRSDNAGAASAEEDADDSDDGAIDLSDLASARFAAGPGASAAISRRSRKPLFAPQKRYQHADEDFTAASRFGALDLTCAQKEDEDVSDSSDEDSRSSYPAMQPQSDDSSDTSITGRAPRPFGLPEPRRADASSMKEYAERTMKELLSIYGLGGESADLLTNAVPMANFRSGKILEALSAVGGPSFGAIPGGSGNGGSLSPSNRPFSSSPPVASQPPSTPPRSPQASGTATVPSPLQLGSSRSSSIPGRDSPNQDMMTDRGGQASHGHPQSLVAALQSGAFDDFRSKMADSVAKFSLGPAGVMGDPRVLLPQNVATIMTLAALQDQQSASNRSGNRSPPSIPPLDPGKIGGLLHGMQPLGAAPGVRELAAAAAAAAAAANNNNNNPSANNNNNTNTKAAVPIDYSRYVKRYGSALECGRSYCKDLNYREHFHCIDCNSRVFVKKEEMIRHFKWHKKRAESLAHGFMRYSPSDDCSDRFRDCSHNRKQTHYHCIKENCDKVYISTSDVQMHANYHRKDSAIIQEGFQRYRATEECRTEYCAFFGQRTTHFHCRRENCKYTFKNKADMEKHKTYHIKDEQLTRDGFKKFMKQDPCPYEGCRFSQNCNHIHCIRSGCSYVLHSSGQLFSHKRKHERKDSELAYRKFKLAQSMIKSFADGQPFAPEQMGGMDDPSAPGGSAMALHNFMAGLHHPQSQHGSSGAMSLSMTACPSASASASTSSADHLTKMQLGQAEGNDGNRSPPVNQSTSNMPSHDGSSTSTPGSSQGHPLLALQGHLPPHFPSGPGRFLPGLDVLPPPPSYLLSHHRPGQHVHESAADLSTSGSASAGSSASASASEEPSWPHPMIIGTPAGSTTCVVPGCDALPAEHWHCAICGPAAPAFRTRDAAMEHVRNHEAQDQVTEAFYVVAGGDVPSGPATAGHCDDDCPYRDKERHFHCTWENCREIILPSDKPFRRLEHYKMHEYSRKLSQSRDPLTTAHLASSIDAMFRRKRGRPPKNRVIEVWNDYMGSGTAVPDSPQAIFTSFKLPKPTPSTAASSAVTSPSQSSTMTSAGQLSIANRQSPLHSQMFAPESAGSPHSPDDSSNAGSPTGTPHPLDLVQDNFVLFSDGQRCGDTLCSLSGRQHFHCKQPRCFYATEREDILLMHAKDFHDNIDILPGFVFFDRSIDCRLASCHSNKVNRHFHCARPGCGFSFVRYSSMSQHEAKHRGETNNNETAEGTGTGTGTVPNATISAAPWASDPSQREDQVSPMSVGEDPSARLGGSPPSAATPPAHLSTPSPMMNPVPSSASPSASSPMSIQMPRPPGTPISSVDRPPSSVGTPVPSSSAMATSPGDSGSRTTVVKASGTFYPLSAFSCSSSGGGGGVTNAKGGAVFPKCLTPQSPMRAPSPTAVPHLAPLPGHLPAHPSGHLSGVPATGVRGPTPPQERRHHFVADIVKTEGERPSLAPHSLARLLQSQNVEMTESTGQHFLAAEQHVRYGPDQSCSRPFCKLKRKEHYHCQTCNQAFSELERLRPHIAKHSSGALSPQGVKREPDEGEDEDSNGPPSASTPSSVSAPPPYEPQQPAPSMDSAAAALGLGLGPPGAGMPPHHPFPPHSFNAAMAAAVANQQFALITSQGLPFMQHGLPAVYTSPSGIMFAPTGFGAHRGLTANGLLEHRLLSAADGSGGSPNVHQHLALSAAAGLKRSMSPHIMGNPQDMSPEAKKARIQNSMRILKDEPVPEGYIRFRFNEDCKYPHCGYREHQTHFHCMRHDCGYSFCDKTRFVQHTARHERLDTLMGGDFQQFRANVSCSRPDCVYTSNLGAVQNKASHFHCLKCDFVCTDTNKVVAHRRQHQKLDSIMAAGFEKFTPSQPCHSESCAHSGKQTHYHCLSCQYAVLGLSQMSAHKFRHME